MRHIKLFEDFLNEGDSNSIYYHVAPERVQGSIKKFGLDANKAPYERSTSGFWVYAFKSLESASWYKNHMSNEPPIEKMNIWEVKANGLEVKKDYTLGPDGDEDDAYMIKGPIAKTRLKLL